MRLSDPQCFRVLGFVCTQPSCCWDGDVGAGGSQSSSSWFCVLLETFVAQGEHPLHRELGKAPGCHCSQMAAGCLRFLPRQVDANPAGFLTLFLPPYIPRAAAVTGPRAWQPSLCSGEVSVQPEAPLLSLRAVPSGDTSLQMGFHRRFPRHGTKWSHVTAELIHPLSPPALPSAGDGPAAVLQG